MNFAVFGSTSSSQRYLTTWWIAMSYLKERVTIIFYIVIIVDCEQWYPVSVTDQTSGFDIIASSSSKDNQYVNKPKWHFSQNHHIDKPQLPTLNQVATYNMGISIAEQSHLLLENSPIFKNSNKTRPLTRRRKVPKICQSVRTRRKKQRNIDTRKGKFLEVFKVVEFQHVICTSSTGLEGTCLHEYECQTAGGLNMGSCADGYATCCVIVFACDGRSSSPMGWFTNPDFPSPSTERISCMTTVDKSSENIQQIRLDFLIFEILSPTSGTCEDDQFLVSGQNVNNLVPILCGINTGQHVYIDVGGIDGPIYLSVQTVTPEKRLYAIKVTQLTKSDELTAPKGCLQYYQDDNGYLESFNYRDNSNIGIPTNSYPSYLNNLNYAMCIERSAMSCSITYTNNGEIQIPNYDTDGLPVIPPKQAGVEIFNCPSDWLLIAAIRLCGERLNDGSVIQDFSLDAPVTDNGAGPLVVWFKSDSGYVGRGFSLYYQQNKCTVSS